MQKLLLSMTIIFPLVFPSPFKFAPGNSQDSVRRRPVSESPLLEIGHASKMRTATDSPSEVKVVSYNIRWRGGEELRNLVQLLKEDSEIGGAAILGLQEVDRNKKRTDNKNTAKHLGEELGMYYAWAAPPVPKSQEEEETGVAIVSSYPLSQVHRIVLPHEGPGNRRRVALGATITLRQTSLRVYSVHSETRISVDKKRLLCWAISILGSWALSQKLPNFSPRRIFRLRLMSRRPFSGAYYLFRWT
jgi:hypothetical protein